jgi:hypothetical protein
VGMLDLLEIEFSLALRNIVNVYDIKYMDYAEVKMLYEKLQNYLNKIEENMNKTRF